MTRLNGRVLHIEERSGVTKEGKPYYGANVMVVDSDNDVSLVRTFDRDGKLKSLISKVKVGSDVCFKVDKIERLANRTLDAFGSFE